MQPQCIQQKKFIHLQVVRPGKDTRRYTAVLGPAIANSVGICSHEQAIVSSLKAVHQPIWPSNNHEAGQIFLGIVPDSHNWGRGERRKILTFQQHSPSMYTENNHRAFFSRLENCPREKSVPSCRSSNRQKLDQGKPSRVTNRRERHRR